MSLRGIAGGALLGATLAGAAYTVLAIAKTRAFRSLAPAPAKHGVTPGLSILKPLHGDEPGLYENLRSFCTQNYPEFQIVFCSADPGDLALAHARRLQREFPEVDIEIAAGGARPARNPKIGNLLGAIDRVKHGIIVISDSDVHAGREYYHALAACFDDPDVGAATSLYGGAPMPGLPSALGAMFVNEQFAPSALVAQAMEPLTYCFGAVMAVRAEVLQGIGGLQALAAHLGDDFRLGQLVSQAGFRVAFCPQIVHTTVNERSLRELWLHELRWARTIRAQRPAGYAGSILTHLLPLAALYASICGSPRRASAALLLAGLLRAALHREGEKSFAPAPGAALWLVPVRDVLSFGVWCAGLAGRRIAWRDQDLAVNADGRLLDTPG